MNGILKEITDNISEGIIVINTEGIITTYNKIARDIFGILRQEVVGHDAGIIKNGDLVFIVDNKFGKDDGNLIREDLKKISIYDDNIMLEDSILCFGIYNKSEKCKDIVSNYKIIKPENQNGKATLVGEHKKVSYELSIDYHLKILDIKINSTSYETKYNNGFGHMIILREGKVLFYQSHGYTARNETIKQILNGKSFREKGQNAKVLEPIGNFLFEIHEKNEEMIEFFKAATDSDIALKNKFMEINGIATLSSITPIYDGNKKYGAMLKVEDITELRKVVEERNILLENLKKTESLLENEKITESFKEFIGVSSHIKNVQTLAYKSSRTNSSVLILGESGTGKSTLAKEIHRLSSRNENKFIHINCASLPESLLESELFGYEGGAFTNSKKNGKIGLLELANGGTLFLDEIGDMAMSTQGKLLNFLQNKKFYRVGGIEEITVDTRIISATNKNLENAIEEGKFREDLYYRINIIPIYIEALRNRSEDVPILVDLLLPKITFKLNKEKFIVTSEAMQKLIRYPWQGNIRELENILERAVSLSDSNVIYSKNLHFEKTTKENKVETGTLKGCLERYECEIILNSLKNNQGNIKNSIKELAIGKTSFYDKIKKYGIKIENLSDDK
ncbi:sigma 54-interacting transcriptional regulator [Clostridium sp.]|uniref:sigma 54-interacting transcriptional regulator n=1 Tax=Clostridium sp. TaxID=1506 RepID=UPI002FC9BAFA